MSQALTRYHALFESLRSRRVKPKVPTGVDMAFGRVLMRAKNRRINIAWLRDQAEQIDRLAPEVRHSSDAVLDEHIARAREVFVRGRADEEGVRRALALTREAARRITGEEPYLVQLMGALALYHGRIIEMLTGEGKTLTGSIAAPLLAWRYRRLHILTVNDYLAARDAQSRGQLYRRCLCDVGAIVQETEEHERFEIYAKPIVYGTPKQITADWLRDQIRMGPVNTPWTGRQSLMSAGRSGGPMIPGLHAAMVDECDAVLIDEGVVPLIIARSRREHDMAHIYRDAARIAAKLDEGPDYSIEHVHRRSELKRRGQHRARQMFDELPDSIWRATRRAEELVRQALVARHCYVNGRQYQVVDGKVMIVDEYTGRFLADRSWEHGLHQAVEAKEGLDVTADRETLARMSFQRFFRSYPFLCGMTGTAADATGEMESVYSRPVIVVPTNRPVIREQWPMRVFRTQESKWRAIAESVAELHAQGRPVLVGTRSVAASELISRLLESMSLPHRVLNANFDKDEAELIAAAGYGREHGREASITVATNMAGRGTDIKPDDAAKKAGGLHVILTELHGAKRIDRQFIGRSGRQGDPGSAQVFVSLEDELVRLHTPRLARLVSRRVAGSNVNQSTNALAPKNARPIASPAVDDELPPSSCAWLFRLAQGRSEKRDRINRASVLRQDDWMDKYLPGR